LSRAAGTRSLAEGALLAAIAVVLVVAGAYLPLVGPLVAFLWPVPIIVIQMRHGLRLALLTLAAAAILLVSFVGPLYALTVILATGTIGIAYGTGFSRRLPAPLILGIGSAAVLVSVGLGIGIALLTMGLNPLTEQLELMREAAGSAAQLYEKLGIPAGQAREQWEAALDFIPYVLPAVLTAGAAVNAFINYVVAGAVLSRLGYHVPRVPPFARWRLPAIAAGGYVLAFALSYAAQRYGLDPLGTIATNLYVAFTLAYFVNGLAVGYHYLGRLTELRWLKVAILAIVSVNPTLFQVAVLLGLVDAAFNVRRIT